MKEIGRYCQLIQVFVKIGLMRQMAYRPHFFLMVAGKTIRIGLLFLFFQAIFLKVDHIGEWTYDQVLLLFATFHIIDYVISITFQRNLSFDLPRLVQTGELDSRLTLPINQLFVVSFENIDLMDFMSFLPSIGFLAYVLIYRLGLNFTWKQGLIYGCLLINAVVLLYAIVLMIAALSFWTVQSYGLSRIFDNLLKVTRYPLDIFGGAWKVIFIYFLPLILVAQIPAQALLRTLTFRIVFLAFAVTFFFLILSLNLWRLGIRRYSSAGT